MTVAAIVERDGRFLVIEEHTSDGLKINQPAGHLEAGETLVDAVKRKARHASARCYADPFLPSTQGASVTDRIAGLFRSTSRAPKRRTRSDFQPST